MNNEYRTRNAEYRRTKNSSFIIPRLSRAGLFNVRYSILQIVFCQFAAMNYTNFTDKAVNSLCRGDFNLLFLFCFLSLFYDFIFISSNASYNFFNFFVKITLVVFVLHNSKLVILFFGKF